jgi:hypothetical protein
MPHPPRLYCELLESSDESKVFWHWDAKRFEAASQEPKGGNQRDLLREMIEQIHWNPPKIQGELVKTLGKLTDPTYLQKLRRFELRSGVHSYLYEYRSRQRRKKRMLSMASHAVAQEGGGKLTEAQKT